MKTWNDLLALIIIPGMPLLWVVNHWVGLPEVALGASITGWILVVQFYFRKAKPEPDDNSD